jgi:hypothetical protein
VANAETRQRLAAGVHKQQEVRLLVNSAFSDVLQQDRGFLKFRGVSQEVSMLSFAGRDPGPYGSGLRLSDAHR